MLRGLHLMGWVDTSPPSRSPSSPLSPAPSYLMPTLAPLQSPRVLGSELAAPLSNRLVGDHDSPLREEIFDVAKAEAESVVEPDGVADDLGGEAVASVE